MSSSFLDYRVYAAGGMGLDLRPHNYLQHYDMLKDMWVSLAPMPTPRYAATSFLRGSKIYVLGKDGAAFSACQWLTGVEDRMRGLLPSLQGAPYVKRSQAERIAPIPRPDSSAYPHSHGLQGDGSPSMQSMPLKYSTSRPAPGPSSPAFPVSGPSPASWLWTITYIAWAACGRAGSTASPSSCVPWMCLTWSRVSYL